MTENKVRTTIWMKPDMLQVIDALSPPDGSKSRSEFVSKAVDFYSGYLRAGQSAGYLSQTLLAEMNGALCRMESKLCRVIFKLAVELAISMNVAGIFSGSIPGS